MMEQLQKGSSKSTHFMSSGPQTYKIFRMNSHNEKLGDKLVPSSSSHKSPREEISHLSNVNRQQEKKIPAVQNQKPDNKYKNGPRNQQKKTDIEKRESKEKTKYQEDLQDNVHGINSRMNQDEEVKLDQRLNINPVGKNTLNEKDDKNEQEEDIPLTHDGQPVLINHIHDDSTENLILKPEESPKGVNAGEISNDSEIDLPPTAIVLTTKGGSKVYVVGTVHFSVESQKDVSDVIRAVHPNYLVIELCLSRAYMLQWNEEHILKEAQQMNFSTMKQIIRRSGIVQGGLYLLMLSLTVQITKQLGVAPGGEFRTAYREALNIPNCVVWFGDRPLEITLYRMLASLSIWQMTKLFFVVLFQNEKIRKEEVENCKNSDVVEKMIMSFTKEMPDFANVILSERDLYLTYSLQVAAERNEPNKVVAVVGIGHLAGIKKNWGKVKVEDVHKILQIPPPRKSTKIIKFAFRFAFAGLIVYGFHKIASKSEIYSNLFSDQSYWNLSNMMYDIWDSPVIQT